MEDRKSIRIKTDKECSIEEGKRKKRNEKVSGEKPSKGKKQNYTTKKIQEGKIKIESIGIKGY